MCVFSRVTGNHDNCMTSHLQHLSRFFFWTSQIQERRELIQRLRTRGKWWVVIDVEGLLASLMLRLSCGDSCGAFLFGSWWCPSDILLDGMAWWFLEISCGIICLGTCLGLGNDGREVYFLTGLQGFCSRPGHKSLKQHEHWKTELPPQTFQDASSFYRLLVLSWKDANLGSFQLVIYVVIMIPWRHVFLETHGSSWQACPT